MNFMSTGLQKDVLPLGLQALFLIEAGEVAVGHKV